MDDEKPVPPLSVREESDADTQMPKYGTLMSFMLVALVVHAAENLWRKFFYNFSTSH